MKTASVADLRNDFARVSKWIDAGEKVTITKRGKPFACLTPLETAQKSGKPKWPDFLARNKAIFGDRVQSAEEAALLLAMSRGEHS